MADERLSDEQVRALASCDWDYGADEVKPLATEVLASRGRRCGNCAYWDQSGWEREPHLGTCLDGVRSVCDGNWFCADFTPKEAK